MRRFSFRMRPSHIMILSAVVAISMAFGPGLVTSLRELTVRPRVPQSHG